MRWSMATETKRVSSADSVVYEQQLGLGLLYRMIQTDKVGKEFLGEGTLHRFTAIGHGVASWSAPWRIHCVNEFHLQTKTKLGDCLA